MNRNYFFTVALVTFAASTALGNPEVVIAQKETETTITEKARDLSSAIKERATIALANSVATVQDAAHRVSTAVTDTATKTKDAAVNATHTVVDSVKNTATKVAQATRNVLGREQDTAETRLEASTQKLKEATEEFAQAQTLYKENPTNAAYRHRFGQAQVNLAFAHTEVNKNAEEVKAAKIVNA
jgi:hypothetical protein